MLFLIPLLTGAPALPATNTSCDNATTPFCCTHCSAGGCSAYCSATNPDGHCAKGGHIVTIPGHGAECAWNEAELYAGVEIMPQATNGEVEQSATDQSTSANDTYCCTTCSAGGCSAEYSPVDEHVPLDAGECIKGGKITPIDPHHGSNCGDPTYCCFWCSAGGCSAEYSMSDEHVPSNAGGCIKGGYIAPIPEHGERCYAHNASAPLAVTSSAKAAAFADTAAALAEGSSEAESDCSVLGCAWAGGLCLDVGDACDTAACKGAYKVAHLHCKDTAGGTR